MAPGDGGRQQRLEPLPGERAYCVHADDAEFAEQDRRAVRQGQDCHIVRPGVIFPHEKFVNYASFVGCVNEIIRRRRRTWHAVFILLNGGLGTGAKMLMGAGTGVEVGGRGQPGEVGSALGGAGPRDLG